MASKKFTLLLLLVVVGATAGFSQLGGTLDYKDSSKLNKRKLPQYNEWKNNNEAFPPVPRAMGQLSIYGGTNWFNGDCPSLPGWQVGVSYRKALGYVLSLRASVGYGKSRGLDYRPSRYLFNAPALNAYSTANGGPGYYVHNFSAEMITGNLDLVASLNSVMFHKKQSKFNVNVFAGYSPYVYRTTMDYFQGANQRAIYNWSGSQTSNDFFSRPRGDIRSDLKGLLDGNRETYAQVNDRAQNFNDAERTARQWRHAISLGAGLEFRVAPRISLGLDTRFLMTGDDYIDGWHLGAAGAPTSEKDNILFTNFAINFNL